MNVCKRPLCALFFAVLAVLAVYYHTVEPDRAGASVCPDGERMAFTGTVLYKEQRKNDEGGYETVYRFRAEQAVRKDGSVIPVSVSMQVYPQTGSPEPATGQRVRFYGTVRCYPDATNPGEFEMRRYYETRGIAFRLFQARATDITGSGSVLREFLYRLRVTCGAVLDACLCEEDAGIMKAVLLGDRSATDAVTKELYRSAGIAHLLAVSGLHFSMAGTCLYRLLQKLRMPQRVAAAAAVLFMVAYALLCGMPSSAIRAVSMFALSVVAPHLERSYDMISAMSFTGLLMLAEQPLYASDSGFLLSFCAVAGLGVLHPALEACTEKRMYRGLSAGISVALTALPVQLCAYGTFSVYSVLINLAVIPLMTLVMPCGFFLLLSGFCSAKAGSFFALPLRLLLWFYRWVCLQNRHLPFHTWYAGHPEAWQIAVYYALLVLFCVTAVSGRQKGLSAVRHLFLPVLAVAALTLRVPPPLNITFLDVGQGDAIVMQRGRHAYLIDGGSTSGQSVGTYKILPFLKHEGIGRLDAVFVSHEDYDHVSGILELFDDMEKGGIRVERLVLPDIGRAAPVAMPEGAEEEEEAFAAGDRYVSLVLRAQRLRIPVSYLSCGMRIEQDGLVFSCLGPDAAAESKDRTANEHSMVLLTEYVPRGRGRRFQALFTGDVEGEGLSVLNETLSRLPEAARCVDVLKVAHHGSRFTTDETFLSLVDASLAVISCGKNNVYGHPHAETMERLRADGARILTTPTCGAIRVQVLRNGDVRVKTRIPERKNLLALPILENREGTS